MRKAIGYSIFALGMAVIASGALTGCAVNVVVAPGASVNTTSGHWQENNTLGQEVCDKEVSKIATEAGVTAENINDPQVANAVRQLRAACVRELELAI